MPLIQLRWARGIQRSIAIEVGSLLRCVASAAGVLRVQYGNRVGRKGNGAASEWSLTVGESRVGHRVGLSPRSSRYSRAHDQQFLNRTRSKANSMAGRLRPSLSQYSLLDPSLRLCAITNSEISMLIEAPIVSPLMSWVTDLAHSTFDGLKDASAKPRPRRTARLCSA
jgi:hypothetical protein